ncbi:MAG: fibronectin type III domain-containing protein, partial [Verrucomicrobiota bacterium]
DPSGDQGSAASDLKAVWIANDRDHVFFRIETYNTHDFHAVGNNLYLDADRSLATGFEPFAAGLVGSELLMQGDGLYSQKLGGWNGGHTASVAIAPYATATTSWEWRIPRNLQHPASAGGGAVFDSTGFRYLVTSGSTITDELSAVLGYTFAVPSVAATITVDGNGADWPAHAKVYDDASGDHASAPSDVKAVWMANDADYVYLRIDTWNAHDYSANYNNTYLDTDADAGTGFHPHGLGFGSELLLQNAGTFSQKNGGWNEGTPTSSSAKNVTMAPLGTTAATWEWRIPRDLVHPGSGGPVFGPAGARIRLLVTSDNPGLAELAPNAATPLAIEYVFAQ